MIGPAGKTAEANFRYQNTLTVTEIVRKFEDSIRFTLFVRYDNNC